MSTINGSSNNVTNQNYINNFLAPAASTPDINKITDAIIDKLAQSTIKIELDQPIAGGKQTLDANIPADRDKLEQLFSQIFQSAVPHNIKNLTDAENDIQGFMAKLDSQRQGASLVSANMLLTVIESYFSYAKLDEDIIDVFAKNMVYHDDKRKELKIELEKISAEMKIYSVVQSEINSALSAASSQTIYTDYRCINLMNYQLYGYSSQAEFKTKAEYQLLQKIVSFSTTVTIRQFLLSADKNSGAMSRVEDSYKYDKDNNRLANFSTMVSDRSRPLSDSISEKTTRLEDAMAVFQLLCMLDHYDSRFFLGLGACRQATENWSAALETYSFATFLDVNDPRFPFHAAECLMQLSDFDGAQCGFESARLLATDKPEYEEIKLQSETMLDVINIKREQQNERNHH